MILSQYEKQPAEVKDYDIRYDEWLTPPSDTLYDVATTVVCTTSDDATLIVDSVDMTNTVAKLWVSGGTAGERYKITVRVTTAEGRIDESELIFKVKDF